MSKQDIKDKYGDGTKIHPISAQDYATLSDTDKTDLDDALTDYGQDIDTYHEEREALIPKTPSLKSLTWRYR